MTIIITYIADPVGGHMSQGFIDKCTQFLKQFWELFLTCFKIFKTILFLNQFYSGKLLSS